VVVPSNPLGLESSAVLERLEGILTRYVSPPTARSIVKLARRRTPGAEAGLDGPIVRAMLGGIERHLSLYVDDAAKQRECAEALRAAVESGSVRPPAAAAPVHRVTLEIRAEGDITGARAAARELAARVGFSSSGQTRVVTAVSELARNIVQYTREGRVELRPTSTPAGIVIVAEDHGPGIPNLDDIFAGKYKSKLGMGLGLRGVKRLSQRFDIKTGVGKGTTVTAFLQMG
jgi:serine/threonine-protein kinase RsbT